MNTRETLVRIVLLSLLLYGALTLASSAGALKRAETRLELLSQELARLEGEKLRLQEKLEQELSAQELEQLARQRLGLVRPGEKIFYFTTDREGTKPWNWQQAASTRARSQVLPSSAHSLVFRAARAALYIFPR